MFNGLDNKIKYKIDTVFNYFVFVLSKTVKSVVGNNIDNRQYTGTAISWPDNRDIRITDGRIIESNCTPNTLYIPYGDTICHQHVTL